jgi:hypothetical protein
MSVTGARCAVVFKTYAWDKFVERQARRLATAAGAMEFYVSVDESHAPVGLIPFERVVRFTCDDLVAAGLPARFSAGGTLWWNPDYAHYQFQTQHPDYDYYLFVEYDCVTQCSLEHFVERAAAHQADFVASPISQTFSRWHWMHYQRKVFRLNEVKLALLNVCLFSSKALLRLHQRRLSMGSIASLSEWRVANCLYPLRCCGPA